MLTNIAQRLSRLWARVANLNELPGNPSEDRPEDSAGCDPPRFECTTMDQIVWAPPAYVCEEGPVTFQIGMIASDGILLASDRLAIKEVGLNIPKEPFETEKIFVHADKHLAYCCAGDELASGVGRIIADTVRVTDQDVRPMLLQCVKQGMETSPTCWFGGSVLLVCGDPPFRLWRVQLNRNNQTGPEVRRVPGAYVTAGQECSYARFFLEQYLPKHRQAKLKAAELVPLAAHTVLTAGDLDPANVRGLEIVTCTNTGFERLPDSRIDELISFSTRLTVQIREELGLPR